MGREARRQQAKQLRSNKREAVAKEKRSLGQGAAPPHVVVVASLQVPSDAAEVAALLLGACNDIAPQTNVEVRVEIRSRGRKEWRGGRSKEREVST
jgi:hypothetical protein